MTFDFFSKNPNKFGISRLKALFTVLIFLVVIGPARQINGQSQNPYLGDSSQMKTVSGSLRETKPTVADSTKSKAVHQETRVAPDHSSSLNMQPIYSMDTVRVYGSRPPYNAFDLASHITRLTAPSFGQGGTLADALSSVSGIFLKEYGAGEGLKTISLRGLGAEHSLILLDGIPLNNPQLGSVNLADYGLSDLSEIEIYRGGQSTLFGSGAVGGVVNLHPGWGGPLKLDLNSETGSYRFQRNSLGITLPTGNVTQTLSFEKSSSPNSYRIRLRGADLNRLNSDFDKRRIDYRLLYRPVPKHSLALQVFSFRNSRGAPRAMTAPNSFQGRARLDGEELLYKLKWNFRPSAVQEWQIQIYRRRDWMDYRDPDLSVNNIIVRSHHYDDEYGLLANMRFQVSPTVQLLGGLDSRYGRVRSSEVLAKQRRQFAVFGLSEWTFWHRRASFASVNLALRQENYSDFGSVLLPRAGLQLTVPQGKFYLSAGKNFRAPTFNDLYWQPGGNPDLKAEKSFSLEAGFAYRWRFITPWEIEFSVYRTALTNMIRWAPVNGSVWRPQNLDRVISRGVEVHLRSEWQKPRIRFMMNYRNGLSRKENNAGPEDATRGNRLPYLPAIELNSSVQGRLGGFGVRIGLNYMGFRYTSIANLAGGILPATTLLNSTLSRELTFNRYSVLAYLRINNLLSAKYQLIGGYPMPLQNWKIGVRFNFSKKNE